MKQLALPLMILIAGTFVGSAQDVPTWHYDNLRSGVQPNETLLNTSNVNSSSFGKVFSLPVLGDVYAQPLYLKQYLMADGQLHDVLILATAEDYVYAFDADGNNPSQGYLWRQSMLGAGETYGSYVDVNVTDIDPYIGIIGTPTIDRAGGTIYLVAKSKTIGSKTAYFQRLHALNIADGAEKLNGPTLIQATVNGLGDKGTTVAFNSLLNNQRASLLLAPTPGVGSGNSVFIAWASHGDLGHYHGWVMAYDAANVSLQNAAWSDTPNGEQGGIWMSGGGPASDGAGNIFLADGNGTFDASGGGGDYGDTALRFTLGNSGLVVSDYFTPSDQNSLDTDDNDMGTAAVMLLPPQAGAIPHLMITADKSGMVYLINRDKMGGYTTPDDSSVQNFKSVGFQIHGSFAFFNNTIYNAPDRAPLQAWTFNPQTELIGTTPQSKSSFVFGCGSCAPTGATPSVSANGTTNGIVWALDNGYYYNDPSVLHAYDATNLAKELYNSAEAAKNRDAAAIAIKFTTPTIASGRVYVGGRNAVTVYGLLGAASTVDTPELSLAAGTYTGTQTLNITDSTENSQIYYTTNGSPATPSATPYVTGIQVANSETIEAIAVAPGLTQSDEVGASYTIQPIGSATSSPQLSLPGGTYTGTQTVTISDVSKGALIYYTTNGSPAGSTSTPYAGGIQVASTETLNAIAIAPSLTQSAPASATYTIQPPALPPAATPKLSLAGGTYTGTQAVTITDATKGAVIHYTTNNTAPSSTSPTYSTAISVAASETIQAIAIASGSSQSAVASATYTIQAPPPPPAQVQVSLASVANAYGIYTDGTKFTTGGFNSVGSAYSKTLVGNALTYAGVSYAFGAANQKDVVRATKSPVVALPAGNYTALKILGAAIIGNQKTPGAFIVTYTDGSSTKFTQSISDWITPQHFAGEAIASTTSYCDTSTGGRTVKSYYIYQYSFALNSAKTVKSLTLPNDSDVVLVAATLLTTN